MLGKTSSETSVLVVSDRGGGPTSDRVVYLNRYLAQLGLLHYRKDERSALSKANPKVIRSSYTLLRSSQLAARFSSAFHDCANRSSQPSPHLIRSIDTHQSILRCPSPSI